MKQKILPGVLIGLLLIINISIPMADSLDTSAALYSNTGRSGLGRANVYVGDGDNDGNKEWASVDDSGFVLYEQSGQTYAATTITKPASPNYGCWGRDITAGDYNCDGYDDIIISNPTFDVNGMGATNGRLIIFPGSANGFSANTAWWVDGTYLNGQTGWSIDTGDFNNDGYDDLIIGSPLANSGTGKVDILLI